MVSPGKLELLAALKEGRVDAYEPTIADESDELQCRPAEQILHERDGPAPDVLEELAQQGLLTRTFLEKVYLCPNCSARDLRYTTACPSCWSLRIVETEMIRHGVCGHVGLEEDFVSEEHSEPVCPGCTATVNLDDSETPLGELEKLRRHVCRACEEQVETPMSRLQCQECPVVEPSEATERVRYRYTLSDTGETWFDTLLPARRAVAEALTDRGFDTRLNTTITTGTDEEIPVHIDAQDDLLDRRVVVGIAEQPTVTDVRPLKKATTAATTQAIVLTTTGTATGRAAEVIRSADMTVLTHQDDGTVQRVEETEPATASAPTRTILKRLTATMTGNTTSIVSLLKTPGFMKLYLP